MRHFRKTVNKQLGEILVERGVLSRAKLEEVLVFQKEKGILFGEALVQMKLGTEEDVVQALTCQYGFLICLWLITKLPLKWLRPFP